MIHGYFFRKLIKCCLVLSIFITQAALAQGTQSQQGSGTAVRAYVISGDVTSAQEAETQIKRRRSL